MFLTALVHDGQRRADPFGQLTRAGHAAHIGRNHHHIIKITFELVQNIQSKNWRGIKVIDRDIEKSLNLRRVQIHRQDALDTGFDQHIGHQLGTDRGAGF